MYQRVWILGEWRTVERDKMETNTRNKRPFVYHTALGLCLVVQSLY